MYGRSSIITPGGSTSFILGIYTPCKCTLRRLRIRPRFLHFLMLSFLLQFPLLSLCSELSTYDLAGEELEDNAEYENALTKADDASALSLLNNEYSKGALKRKLNKIRN